MSHRPVLGLFGRADRLAVTVDELRQLVFTTSTVYLRAMQEGKSIQEAEWERAAALDLWLADRPR